MTDPTYIPLRRERTVTDTLNVTFTFIREEWRGLGKSLLVYVGPLVVLWAMLMFGERAPTLESILADGPLDVSWTRYALAFLAQSVALFVGAAVVYAYTIRYADDGPGPFEPSELKSGVIRAALVSITTGLWIGLLMMPVFLLLFIPIVGWIAMPFLFLHLMILYSLVIPARVDRGEGFWPALRRVRMLIKGEWWATLGLLILTGVVVMLIAAGLSAIALLAGTLVDSFLGQGIIAQVLATLIAIPMQFGGYAAYAVMYVAFVIYYFGLTEAMEGVGLEARIEAMAAEAAGPNALSPEVVTPEAMTPEAAGDGSDWLRADAARTTPVFPEEPARDWSGRSDSPEARG